MNKETIVCPKCFSENLKTERRPNGNTICENGHQFPTSESMTAKECMLKKIEELQKIFNEMLEEIKEIRKIDEILQTEQRSGNTDKST